MPDDSRQDGSMCVWMNDELHRRFKARASHLGMKLKEATEEAIEQWLEVVEDRPPKEN